MPWDEPPPRRKRPRQGEGNGSAGGPPELDEVLNEFRKKFSSIFSGGRRGSQRGAPPPPDKQKSARGGFRRPNRTLIGLIIIVALGVWGASGLYVVEQGEQAVELRFGEYTQTKGAGLRWHIPTPIEEALIVNVQKVNTVEVGYRVSERNRAITPVTREALMLTADENIIDIQFAVQYDVKDPKDLLFNVSDPVHLVVRQATESAVREIVGGNTMDFAITEGRAEIAQGTKVLLQDILDRYRTGVNVRAVEMQNAQPPAEVKAAFDDAVKAREDEERLKNEAEAYANDIIPRARGQAARIVEEAQAYRASVIARAEGEASRFQQIYEEYRKAPEITRDRLYLESVEQVLINSTKLIVDQEGGNNILYLPLDQIMRQREPFDSSSSGSTPLRTSPGGSGFESGVGSNRPLRTDQRTGRLQG